MLRFISDNGNNCIRKATPSGQVSTFSGTSHTAGSLDGSASGAQVSVKIKFSIFEFQSRNRFYIFLNLNIQFSGPRGMVIDSSNTYLYVGCQGDNTVRRVLLADGSVTTVVQSSVGQPW